MNQLLKIESHNLPTLGNLRSVKSKLRLVAANEIRIVNKCDILFLKSDSNYCYVHFVDGSSMLCAQTLKSIYDRLGLGGFYRTHASYVINVDHIASVSSSCDQLTLDGMHHIPISRANKKLFKARLDSWFD